MGFFDFLNTNKGDGTFNAFGSRVSKGNITHILGMDQYEFAQLFGALGQAIAPDTPMGRLGGAVSGLAQQKISNKMSEPLRASTSRMKELQVRGLENQANDRVRDTIDANIMKDIYTNRSFLGSEGGYQVPYSNEDKIEGLSPYGFEKYRKDIQSEEDRTLTNQAKTLNIKKVERDLSQEKPLSDYEISKIDPSGYEFLKSAGKTKQDTSKFTETQLKSYNQIQEMITGGASLAEINNLAMISGIPGYKEIKTGKMVPKEGTGIMGMGQEMVPETKIVPVSYEEPTESLPPGVPNGAVKIKDNNGTKLLFDPKTKKIYDTDGKEISTKKTTPGKQTPSQSQLARERLSQIPDDTVLSRLLREGMGTLKRWGQEAEQRSPYIGR